MTSIAAVIAMAAPAHADSDGGDDHAFLAAPTTRLDILRDIRDLNPGFTMDGAARFAEVAANSTDPTD